VPRGRQNSSARLRGWFTGASGDFWARGRGPCGQPPALVSRACRGS